MKNIDEEPNPKVAYATNQGTSNRSQYLLHHIVEIWHVQ
jgi:hypothetical protein